MFHCFVTGGKDVDSITVGPAGAVVDVVCQSTAPSTFEINLGVGANAACLVKSNPVLVYVTPTPALSLPTYAANLCAGNLDDDVLNLPLTWEGADELVVSPKEACSVGEQSCRQHYGDVCCISWFLQLIGRARLSAIHHERSAYCTSISNLSA